MILVVVCDTKKDTERHGTIQSETLVSMGCGLALALRLASPPLSGSFGLVICFALVLGVCCCLGVLLAADLAVCFAAGAAFTFGPPVVLDLCPELPPSTETPPCWFTVVTAAFWLCCFLRLLCFRLLLLSLSLEEELLLLLLLLLGVDFWLCWSSSSWSGAGNLADAAAAAAGLASASSPPAESAG